MQRRLADADPRQPQHVHTKRTDPFNHLLANAQVAHHPTLADFRTAGLEGLLRELGDRPDVSHVFVVTDSEEGFAEVAERLPLTVQPRMLWRDYLGAFSTGMEAGR